MLDTNRVDDLVGTNVLGTDGSTIGSVGQVYVDDTTGTPSFVTVKTGLFGIKESFVPLQDATLEDEGLRVPYEKSLVKDAPTVDPDGHISEQEERQIFEHYQLSSGWMTSGEGIAPAGYDTSGPTTDDAMTRSEEQLSVGTTRQEAGRARLRKYVVTEQETVTVPVRKERAVLETEPITDGNVGAATSGPAISEEEHEVVLHEERVVVDKQATPVERVRLGTEEVVSQETVTEDVRKERIEAEGDIAR
jgi:uncharacterized protein (TIGR02271 family)